jgi:hypothetical protein
LFNPITRLFPTANKAIESQSEISLRSSAGGPTIGVANGTKTKEDLNISPPPKSRKMKIELQMSDKPLIIFNHLKKKALTLTSPCEKCPPGVSFGTIEI